MLSERSELPAVLKVGQVILADDEMGLSHGEKRQRACLELLRQAAIEAGLLAATDSPPQGGVFTEEAIDAIDRYLLDHVTVPEPDDGACRRYHAAHAAKYAIGESLLVRHILFAVTPGVDVQSLRSRAERALLDVRADPTRFGEVARDLSNCPSSEKGGDLGWLTAQDCAPEFAKELFAQDEAQANVGVLPRLVHSRFGLHVVEVQARQPGQAQPYEVVQQAVAQALHQQAWITALRQTMSVLASRWDVQGIDLDSADSPLLQ